MKTISKPKGMNKMIQFKRILLAFIVMIVPVMVGAQAVGDALLLENEMLAESKSQKVPLSKELKQVEKKFGVQIFYLSNEVNGKYVPSSKNEEMYKNGVKSALNSLLFPVNMKFRKLAENSYAVMEKKRQNILQTVSGTVTDLTSGETLPGVNILVKGTNFGTATNVEGQYSLDVPSLQDTLVFSFVGYQTQEIPINGRTTIDVRMQSQALTGEELVVVGYGTQKRSSISSSVSDITSEEFEGKTINDTRRALQGIAPGLSIIDEGGAPGSSDIRIMIRGNTTIGDTQPLILVNGIEQDFSSLNPDNIESISVLKDASATAIYGSRAANGVILVKTKTPQSQGLKVSYNGSYGFSNPTNLPEHLGTEEYLRLQNYAEENAGAAAPYTEQEIQEYVRNVNEGNTLEYPVPNPFFEELLGPAPIQDHSLAISGGSDRSSSRLSLRLLDEQGILKNFDSSTKEVRFDNHYEMTSWLNFDTRLTYRRKDMNQPLNNPIFGIWHGSQWAVPQFPDGTFGLNSRNNNSLQDLLLEGSNNSNTDYFVGNMQADVDLLDNLSYSIQFGGFASIQNSDAFARTYRVSDNTTGQVLTNSINSLNENRSKNQRWTWRNLINYQLDLSQHQLKFLVGYEQTWADFEDVSAFRQNFYTNSLQVLDAGSRENLNNGGVRSEERLRSVFGRVNYTLDEKYILEANLRYDGSSKFFGAQNQYSFFPSFSAAWRISDEPFWEPLNSTISDLKLRGSWGKTGNNTVALYTFFQGINVSSNYTFGGDLVQTAGATGLVNPNLTWETTTQSNIGIDAELWKGVLNFSFDYWEKKTNDILLNLPIPSVVGFEGPPQNAGRVDNKGWDLSITHKNTVNSDFSYSITGNVSDFRSEIKDLARTGPFFQAAGGAPAIVTKTGEPLNALWGYKSLGLFQSRDEINNYPTIIDKADMAPGDMKYADLNEDGEITPDDKTVIGEQDPHYSFGLTTDFNYKNWNLSVFIQGVGEQDRVPIGAAIECGNWLGYTLDVCGDYWTPENTDARIPRPQKRSRHNNTPEVISDWWVVDASYIRLKNVQLGYNVPSELISEAGIENMRFYLSGTNIFWISDAKKWGLDPEFRTGRLGFYPQSSQYVLGINLEF